MSINRAAQAISARGVRKSFGEHLVLDDVDLTVTDGTIFALLGPNGAGKTTMVRILSTLIRADAGDMRVGGHDVATQPDAVRALIGVTGQFSAVDNYLTGEENLRLMADLRHLGRTGGRARVAELLERFDLTMWQIIRELVTDGVTIFLTTQYLDEADQLADRVAVLDHGRIVAEGTPAELKSRIPGGHVKLHFAGSDALRSAAGIIPDAALDEDQLTLQIPGDGSVASLRRVLDTLDGSRIDVDHLSIHMPDLDDVFFAVTGHATTEPTDRQEEEALQR